MANPLVTPTAIAATLADTYKAMLTCGDRDKAIETLASAYTDMLAPFGSTSREIEADMELFMGHVNINLLIRGFGERNKISMTQAVAIEEKKAALLNTIVGLRKGQPHPMVVEAQKKFQKGAATKEEIETWLKANGWDKGYGGDEKHDTAKKGDIPDMKGDAKMQENPVAEGSEKVEAIKVRGQTKKAYGNNSRGGDGKKKKWTPHKKSEQKMGLHNKRVEELQEKAPL